jgi:cytochrome c biogenesis protein CcmG/thiol:disulfide interchange protein DsbE
MKQLFSRLSSVILVVLLLIVGFQRFPIIYENIKAENQKVEDISLTNIQHQSLQLAGNKTILVFWATWCPPCKVELGRINELIKENKLPADKVIAVSMGESRQVVEGFLQKTPYLFQIVLDENGSLSEKFQVQVTPTLLFIEKDLTVSWRTTGVSPLLSYKIASFIND